MNCDKKIIKAITLVVVETMKQHGTALKGKNDKNITKRVVKEDVKALIRDDDLDYQDIVNTILAEYLNGIKL